MPLEGIWISNQKTWKSCKDLGVVTLAAYLIYPRPLSGKISSPPILKSSVFLSFLFICLFVFGIWYVLRSWFYGKKRSVIGQKSHFSSNLENWDGVWFCLFLPLSFEEKNLTFPKALLVFLDHKKEGEQLVSTPCNSMFSHVFFNHKIVVMVFELLE